MGADGTAIPAAASSRAVHGPAQTMTWPAVTAVPPSARMVTCLPSSEMPVTRTPARTGSPPGGPAAASARSALSAAITADSGSSSAGPPTVMPGNLAAASRAVSSSQGAPARCIPSSTACSPSPNVRCGAGRRIRSPDSSSSSRHSSLAARAMAT